MPNILMRKAGLAFDLNKTRLALKKATLRLVILIESKTSSVKAKRSKAAVELESGLQRQAYIDVEQVIRQDFTIEAYETLLHLCNRLADRMGVVAAEKWCPSEVKQAVCTIIWAADKAEVPELLVVKAQLTRKYGKEFALKAQTNADRSVNIMVAEKLLYQNDPSANLVNDYLVAIAMELNVDMTFTPSPIPVCPSTKSTAATTTTAKTEAETSPSAFKTQPTAAPPTTTTETAPPSRATPSTPAVHSPLTPGTTSSASKVAASSSPIIIAVSTKKPNPATAALEPRRRPAPQTVNLSLAALRTVRRAAPTSHPVGHGFYPAALDAATTPKLYI